MTEIAQITQKLACCSKHQFANASPANVGSRRKRVWELPAHMHCPVVGVCLPVATMRQLIKKLFSTTFTDRDYDLHSSLVAECQRRSPITEAVQKDFDARFSVFIKQATHLKSPEALLAWWYERGVGTNLPGTFWAVLTHPQCKRDVETTVLGEVHMMQHQLGGAARNEQAHISLLLAQVNELQEKSKAQSERAIRISGEQLMERNQQTLEIARLRADLLNKNALIAEQKNQLTAFDSCANQTPQRRENTNPTHKSAEQNTTIAALRQEIQLLKHEAFQSATLRVRVPPDLEQQFAQQPTVTEFVKLDDLIDQTILCVGGRTSSIPMYRKIISKTGAKFVHHDGGEHDNISQLDATLSAADMVICQTGCISHDAYWRVKDHCKRFGKRCVFVETPSPSSLVRALKNQPHFV